jgi:hypothetical protein
MFSGVRATGEYAITPSDLFSLGLPFNPEPEAELNNSDSELNCDDTSDMGVSSIDPSLHMSSSVSGKVSMSKAYTLILIGS